MWRNSAIRVEINFQFYENSNIIALIQRYTLFCVSTRIDQSYVKMTFALDLFTWIQKRNTVAQLFYNVPIKLKSIYLNSPDYCVRYNMSENSNLYLNKENTINIYTLRRLIRLSA